MPDSIKPFSDAFPNVDAVRVRYLLASEEYAPVVDLVTLRRQLQGEQLALVKRLWVVVLKTVKAELYATGHTSEEIKAAIHVTIGDVLPPR